MDAAPKLSTIGKYSLIASLGQGGMAKVYLALMAGPAGFNKLLVIKALREDMLSSSEEFVHMFLDEARLAARLNHQNIVQTYEVGESEGRYFIAMEYLEGQSLRTIQRRLSPHGLPLEEELRVIAETAKGLHYAHDLAGFDGEKLGVVHRDVSPQNVFLTYDGQVKLLDFGIAKTQDAEHLTKVGVIKGKIDYIAPEQIRGDKVDRRADIFALGAMLWEAVTGRRFAGGPKVADVTKIHTRVTGGEPKLRELKPDVPEQLACIVEKAIALDPNDRYQTALMLADEIEAYLDAATLKPSSKSLAELIAPPFEAERAKMRKLIDQQIQIVQKRGGVALGETTGGLPRIGPNHTRTASGVRPPDVDLTESGFLDLGSDASIPTVQTAHSMQIPVPVQLGQPQRAGVPKMAVVAVLSAAIAGAALMALRPDAAPEVIPAAPVESAASAPIPTPSVTEEEAPPPPNVPDVQTVKLTVDVWPSDAHVSLDGAQLPKIPYTAEFRKDRATHHLEAFADGYVTQNQLVSFDQDREIKFVLERVPAQPAAPQRRSSGRGNQSNNAAQQQAVAQPSAPQAENPPPKRDEEIAPGADLVPSKPRIKANNIDLDDPYAK